jgi:hypothetical protein
VRVNSEPQPHVVVSIGASYHMSCDCVDSATLGAAVVADSSDMSQEQGHVSPARSWNWPQGHGLELAYEL